MTTIKLEIGPDLRKAINKIADTSYHADVGSNIKKAFGIDFSKVIKRTDVLDVCINAKCPRCFPDLGPTTECTVEIKQ